jgi:hypothetical protein
VPKMLTQARKDWLITEEELTTIGVDSGKAMQNPTIPCEERATEAVFELATLYLCESTFSSLVNKLRGFSPQANYTN